MATPTYNTIPAAAEDSLLAPKKNNRIKGLVACAGLLAFALGAVAATATRATPAKEVVNLSKGGDCNCAGGWAPDNYADLRACLNGCGAGATVKLGEGDFWLGPPQYQVPSGMSIEGAGPGKTRITATNPVNEGDYKTDCKNMDPSKKIGFILGDNTNFQDFTYVSLDTGRLDMDSGAAGLCGGAVFEAPGCTTSDCGLEYGVKNQKVLSSDGNDYIEHATIQGIFITGKDSPDDTSPCWEDDSNTKASFKCNSAPQSALYIPWSGNGGGCTNNVIIQDVTMLQSWADSVNIHGCANNILVQNNWFYQAGNNSVSGWAASRDFFSAQVTITSDSGPSLTKTAKG